MTSKPPSLLACAKSMSLPSKPYNGAASTTSETSTAIDGEDKEPGGAGRSEAVDEGPIEGWLEGWLEGPVDGRLVGCSDGDAEIDGS